MSATMALSVAPVYALEQSTQVVISSNDEVLNISSVPSDGLSLSTSRARWSYVNKKSMFVENDSTYLVDATGSQVVVSEVLGDESTVVVKSIDMELPLYGGFFAGQNYNYIVFGQENSEAQGTNLETFKIVKYDKNFNKINSFSASNGDTITTVPFDAGSLRMAENSDGSELTVHTSREMFVASDGYNHQAQLTFVINTQDMTKKNKTDMLQGSHQVSHSFNQFVQYDNDKQVLIDHGDAYPRAVVLHEAKDGTDYSNLWTSHTKYNLLEIAGETGANCTGVTVGGFEISNSSYLVAINKIDFDKVTSFNSFQMVGLDIDERDVVLLVMDKNSKDVNQITIQEYVDTGKTSSTPRLVSFSDDQYMVIWQEHDASTTSGFISTKYVMIDGTGNKTSQIFTVYDTPMSAYIQPVVIDGEACWIAGEQMYSLNPAGVPVSIENATISGLETSYTETFEEIVPEITVVVEGITLTLGQDYKIEYSNNVEAGTASVVVTGMNGYKNTITANFEITEKLSVIDANYIGLQETYALNEENNYDFSANTVDFTVKIDGNALVLDVDYTVSYDLNQENGLGFISIVGIGEFKGEITKTVNITDDRKEDLDFKITSIEDLTVGDIVSITTNCDGNITFETSDSSVISIEDAIMTAENTGTAVITAVRYADEKYNIAQDTIVITVNKSTSSDGSTGGSTGDTSTDDTTDDTTGDSSTGGSTGGSTGDTSTDDTTDDTTGDTTTDDTTTGDTSTGGSTNGSTSSQTTAPTVEDMLDVSTSAWYYESVNFVLEKGLFAGATDNEFKPNNNMSRAMLWTVLYRYDGGTGVTTGANWYDEAQKWAISQDVSDGTNPNDDMTREQLATILYRFEGEPELTSTLETSENVSFWAESAMAWAVSEGLIQGDTDGNLNPTNTATRAEVATILMRYINK